MGRIYRSTLVILRSNPGSTLGLTAALLITIAVLGLVARLPLVDDSRWTPAVDKDILQVFVTLGLYPAGAVLVTLTWVLVSIGVTAIGSVVTHRWLAGERTTLRGAWHVSAPRLPGALRLGVLDVLVVLAPFVMAGAVAIALGVATGPGHARLQTTVLFALAGAVVLAVLPTLVLAGPMLVIEELRPMDALWRAVDLQRRGYWRLLGRVVCTYLIVGVVLTVLSLPFAVAALDALPGDDWTAQSYASLVFTNVGWVVGQVAVMPFLIVTNAQLYDDQVARSGSTSGVSAPSARV